MVSGATAGVAREASIGTEMDCVAEMISRLESQHEELEKRLGPLFRGPSVPPPAGAGDARVVPSGSATRLFLRNQRDRLLALSTRADDMLQRLDL